MDKDIQDALENAEKAKSKLLLEMNKYNLAFNKLTSEDKKEIGQVHNDINKMVNMIKNGNYNESEVEQIKAKYAN